MAMARRGPVAIAFGAVVRNERKARKMTQAALANASGTHMNHIGAIERGETDLMLSSAYKMAAAFGMPLSELVDRMGMPVEPAPAEPQPDEAGDSSASS